MLELKQEDLAGEAATQRSVLAAFERGRSTPRQTTTMRIKSALEARGVVFIESAEGRGVMLKGDA
jgi:ribosome-binding protein aMBF1 (putative translation factor)